LRLLFLPSVIVIGINIGIFFRFIAGSFGDDSNSGDCLGEPSNQTSRVFRYTYLVLIGVAVAYVLASAARFPLSLVAAGGALLLLMGALAWRQTSLREIGKRISWSIFGFIAGYVHRGPRNRRYRTYHHVRNWLLSLSGGNSFGAVMVGTAGAALGTNLINNIPMGRGNDLCPGKYPTCAGRHSTRVPGGYDVWL